MINKTLKPAKSPPNLAIDAKKRLKSA